MFISSHEILSILSKEDFDKADEFLRLFTNDYQSGDFFTISMHSLIQILFEEFRKNSLGE